MEHILLLHDFVYLSLPDVLDSDMPWYSVMLTILYIVLIFPEPSIQVKVFIGLLLYSFSKLKV